MRKNMAGMTMHLDGVKRMVAIRGGLKKIKDSSPAVANLVYRYVRKSLPGVRGAKIASQTLSHDHSGKSVPS